MQMCRARREYDPDGPFLAFQSFMFFSSFTVTHNVCACLTVRLQLIRVNT